MSWFSDYQARRANIRYRPAEGQGHRDGAHAQRLGPRRAPGVGGLVETHRQPDGSVRLPEVLLPYMRGATEIR